MMLVLLDENTDATRVPPGFDEPPTDPAVLYIFNTIEEWQEVVAAGGDAMNEFYEYGEASAELVSKCADELADANDYPFHQEARVALKIAVGSVIVANDEMIEEI